jgi:hypothetical protein
MLNATKTDTTKYKRFIFFILLYIMIYFGVGHPLTLRWAWIPSRRRPVPVLGIGRPLYRQSDMFFVYLWQAPPYKKTT